ncbi:unnamed protein product, partial [Pylaiella littoralis]
MSSAEVIEIEAENVWKPLSAVDYSLLGFIGALQVLSLLMCVHLLRWRKWPPYVTKNVSLVVITTVSGVLWTLAMALSCGFFRRREGDLLAACDLERFLTWSTMCVHTVAFFIRVYRMWRILIKHDDKMWPTEYQIMFMSSISLVPVVVTWIAPHTGFFDERTNLCVTTTLSNSTVLVMDALGFLAIGFLWFVCARQLKWVRRQFNEYETMKRTLLYMTITLASYVGVVLFLLDGKYVLQRRVAIFYPLMTTAILLWGSIREPFMNKMLGNNEYLLSYTKGFAELPSPAQLRASLAEQLSVDHLREEFRRYIKTKVAQELVDFYLDSLHREEVTGFFERQAVTMRIVEQYIREGAPDQVNISGECRDTVLATDVTAYDIFDEARAEVLLVMETNFQREFVTTEGFRRIQDASEEEQRELRLLRAGGMLPQGSPSRLGSPAEKTPSPPSALAVALAVGTVAKSNGKTPPPRSPSASSFLPGLVDAFKKLPFLGRNAKVAASESRRPERRASAPAAAAAAAALSTDGAVASESSSSSSGSSKELEEGRQGRQQQHSPPKVVSEAAGAAGTGAVVATVLAATAGEGRRDNNEDLSLPPRKMRRQDHMRLGLTIGTTRAAGGTDGDGTHDNGRNRSMPGHDGFGGLDGLSSVSTEDSPDWVRFADWVQNGEGQGVSQRRSSGAAASCIGGGGGRGGGGGGSVGAGRRLRDVEEGFGPDGGGRDGRGGGSS